MLIYDADLGKVFNIMFRCQSTVICI